VETFMATDTTLEAPRYDFASPEFFADPFAMYGQMRTQDPVYWHPAMNAWIVTRHADVLAVARSTQFSSERVDSFFLGIGPGHEEDVAVVRRFFVPWLTFSDPPNHSRVKTLMTKAFSARAILALQPFIASVVTEALDEMAPGTEVDLVERFALPVPAKVIAHMLGVAPQDFALFQSWTADVLRVASYAGDPVENVVVAAAAARNLEQYFRVLIEDRRNQPREDILSGLVHASEQGDVLTEQELVSSCAMLLLAGFETTANMIGTSVLTLLRHPDQLELLRKEPERMAAAVEELLRFDGVAPTLVRVAKEDVEIGGETIPAGNAVFCMTHAANRDDDVFGEPDRFDITRVDAGKKQHLAFGSGAHFCIGAYLAKLEIGIALGALLERFPDIQLTGEPPTWAQSLSVRGVTSLRVSL
jgi:cytochrome P450